MFYSVGGTVLLTPAYGAGSIVGPSFGHFYTRNYTQALIGIGIRTGGAVLFTRGFNESFTPFSDEESSNGEMQMAVGATILAGSALFDIVTAWGAAQDYNESLTSNVRVTPAANPHTGQTGLTLTIQL